MDRALIFLGIGIGAILAIVALPVPFFVSGPIILFAVCWTYAAICTLSQKQRAWLENLFAPTNGGTLYLKLIEKPASWPIDWRVYDLALLLAVFYPMSLGFLAWILTGQLVTLGGDPNLGGMVLFAPPENWWERPVMICLFGVILASHPAENWAKKNERAIIRKTAIGAASLPILIAMAMAYYVSRAGVGSGAVAFAIACVFALSLRGKFVGGLALALAVSAPIAFTLFSTLQTPNLIFLAMVFGSIFALSLTVEILKHNVKPAYHFLSVTVFSIGALFWALVSIEWAEVAPDAKFIYFFVGLIPLVSALLDTPSYIITLRLARAGFKRPTLALPFSLFDLAIALCLFYLTGAALVLIVAYANQLAGLQLFPLAQLLSDVADMPNNYWWLYAMVFSTVLPTMLHLSAASFSTSAWFLPSWRARILRHIDSEDPLEALEVISLIAVFFLASLTLPFVFLFLLAIAANAALPGYLSAYLIWLQDIACWAGPLSCPS